VDTPKTDIPVKPEHRKESERVDARHLHSALGVGRHFTSWIQSRIVQFGFVCGKDYRVVQKLQFLNKFR
jgi:phage anti-repressor protein